MKLPLVLALLGGAILITGALLSAWPSPVATPAEAPAPAPPMAAPSSPRRVALSLS